MKVSVIIPVYNRSVFVVEAINSVLQQTYRDFEIIVVDDGSTDDTCDVLQPYVSKGIISLISQKNKGAGAARNAGIRAARGEYIAFLDSDDLWLPNKLEKSLLPLENGICDFVFSNSDVVDGEGEFLFSVQERFRDYLHGDLFENLLDACFISTPGVVLRRDCFDRVGLFREDLKYRQDYDMWLRLARKCRFLMLTDKLNIIRRHGGQLVATANEQSVACSIMIFESLLYDQEPVAPLIKRKLHKGLGKLHFDLAYYYFSVDDFIKSVRTNATSIRYYPLRLSVWTAMIKACCGVVLGKNLVKKISNHAPRPRQSA